MNWAPFAGLPSTGSSDLISDSSGPKVSSAACTSNTEAQAALVDLGRELMRQNYSWVCPSLETQRLVNGRFANRRALSLPDLFGWNRVGMTDTLARQLPSVLIDSLCEHGVLQIADGETVRSRVRFSSFADTLLSHSALPASNSADVVVGPDTHRFGAFVARELLGPCAPLAVTIRPFTLVDLGCGSGAAGILAARMLGAVANDHPMRVLLVDQNPRALRFAEVNARLANLPHFECRRSDLLAAVTEPPMLVLANPPGLMDSRRGTSLHGGGELGTGLAVRIVDECLDRLLPGGSLMMCAVAPVVRGEDILLRSVEARIMRTRASRPATLRYEVLEIDVSAHQLALPDYAEVDRVALVGLTVQVKAPSRRHLPTAARMGALQRRVENK